MADAPRPMDPGRLAELRHLAAKARVPGWTISPLDLEELLADRDYQAQRADAEQVVLAELPGDCWPEYEGAPAVARLVELANRANAAEAEVARLRSRVRVEAEDVERAGVTWAHIDAWLSMRGEFASGGRWCSIAVYVRALADELSRPGLDILDEMARMEVKP